MFDVICLDNKGNPITRLTQWDVDQTLLINLDSFNFKINNTLKVHFCNKESKNALVVESTIENNELSVHIPNELLRVPYKIVAYLYFDGKTICTIEIPVKKRKKPSNYIYSDDLHLITIEDLINNLNSEIKQILENTNEQIDEIKKHIFDSKMSDNSTNAVQNKVVKKYIDDFKNQNATFETLGLGKIASVGHCQENNLNEKDARFVNPYTLKEYMNFWWDGIKKKPTLLGAYIVDDNLEITGGLIIGGDKETIIGGTGNLIISGEGVSTFAKSNGTVFATSVTMNKNVNINAPVTISGNPLTVNSDINTNGKFISQAINMNDGIRQINIGTNNILGVEAICNLVIGNNNSDNGGSNNIIVGNDNNIGITQSLDKATLSIIVGNNNKGISKEHQFIFGNYNNIASARNGNPKIEIFGDNNTVNGSNNQFLYIVGTNNQIGLSEIKTEYTSIFGINHKVNGSYSIILGRDNICDFDDQFITGYFNKQNQNALFQIGNGESEELRKNAFEVTKDGNAIASDFLIENDNGDLLSVKGLMNQYNYHQNDTEWLPLEMHEQYQSDGSFGKYKIQNGIIYIYIQIMNRYSSSIVAYIPSQYVPFNKLPFTFMSDNINDDNSVMYIDISGNIKIIQNGVGIGYISYPLNN